MSEADAAAALPAAAAAMGAAAARNRGERFKKFRYGEIEFEETGARVPYLLIPDTDEGHDPAKVVEYMVKHLKFNGKQLVKPNICFRVRARGHSYMEWAKDVWDNDFLAQKWKWKELRDSSEPPRTIPTDEQYKQDETGRLYRLPNDQLAQVPVQQKEGARDRGEAYVEPFNLVTLVELDDALREFSDKLIAIFRDVVLGVVNSDGWFLFPAGRRPRHQLIGEHGRLLTTCLFLAEFSHRRLLLCRRHHRQVFRGSG